MFFLRNSTNGYHKGGIAKIDTAVFEFAEVVDGVSSHTYLLIREIGSILLLETL